MEQGYKLTSKGGKSLSIIQAKLDWRGIRFRKWRCYTAQPKRKVDDKKNEGYPGLSSETKLQGSNLDKVYQDVTMLEFPAPAAGPLKSSGLNLSPQSGGVENATARCDLPSPAVAVRNLVEQAQYAHLCTIMSAMHHRRAGYPFGTIVDFAADGAGFPIFSMSPLAIQTRNIMEDPRCSLVMQMPGWSGLANARVTMFGDVYALPKSMQSAAADIFHQKMSITGDAKQRWVSGNAVYFRMDRILDIYFVGGFGTVQWVDVCEYSAAKPDQIVVANPLYTLQVLNQTFSEPLRKLFSEAYGLTDDAAFISIDKRGVDVRLRRGGDYSIERFGFDTEVESLEDAVSAMQRLLSDVSLLKVRS